MQTKKALVSTIEIVTTHHDTRPIKPQLLGLLGIAFNAVTFNLTPSIFVQPVLLSPTAIIYFF
jgi:hypothetical protein